MKRMLITLACLLSGLALCGLWVHVRRNHSPTVTNQPVHDWQRRITIDSRMDYLRQLPLADRRRLDREERRQRPEEGRN
jgi:hypothetical protein